MADINRNGKAYDSADVTVQINGVPINVKSVSYGNEQEHQVNHTLSEKPSSWSKGKITPQASMTLMMGDVAPLEKAAKGNLLSLKPFTMTIEFANDFNEIIVDKVVAKFQKEGREVTGDMGLEYAYDLFALDVKLNVEQGNA